jgi:hypothetical protein
MAGPSTLLRIHQLIVAGDYIASAHAMEPLLACDHEERDIEECIATGEIRRRRRDPHREAVDGYVYEIHGRACAGYPFMVCGKLIETDDGVKFFIITAHRREA